MTKLSSILVLSLIHFFFILKFNFGVWRSYHFVDFDTLRVKPNPNRTTVPRGITHFLSSTCTRQIPNLSLSLNSIHHHILISLSIFSLLFHSIPQAPPQRCRIATLEHKHLPQPPPHPPSHPPMLISTMTSKSSTEPTVAVLPKSFSSSVSPPFIFILIFLIYSILNFAEFVENDLNG